jgi:hypothetical protein
MPFAIFLVFLHVDYISVVEGLESFDLSLESLE